MFNAFDTFVDQYGEDAIIIHRTPQMRGGSVVKDAKNHTLYDEEEIEVRCRIKKGGGGKGYVKNPNAFQEQYDAVAEFKLSDIEYLNTQSRIRIEYTGDIIETYNMKGIAVKKTHVRVTLKSREV